MKKDFKMIRFDYLEIDANSGYEIATKKRIVLKTY